MKLVAIFLTLFIVLLSIFLVFMLRSLDVMAEVYMNSVNIKLESDFNKYVRNISDG